MKNLAGVETAIADAALRIELAKAGIPVYRGEVIRSQEVPATMIGVITYAAGVKATFSRGWYYWCVCISQPLPFQQAKQLNDQWGSKVRVDGYAGGKEPSQHGVSSYNIDSQEGLNALVSTLNETFGMQIEANPEDIKLPDWLRPYSLKKVDSPEDAAALVRAEIAALNALGGYYNRYEMRESAGEEALALAFSAFGGKDHDTYNMRVVVNNLYREQARRLKMLIETISDQTSIYCFTADLEGLLNKRVPLLHTMGRHKEARSVARESEEVRKKLAEIYRERKQADHKDLQEALAGKPDRVEYARYGVAFTTMRMAQLYRRMGDAAQAETLEAELAELSRQLTEDQRADLERRAA